MSAQPQLVAVEPEPDRCEWPMPEPWRCPETPIVRIGVLKDGRPMLVCDLHRKAWEMGWR